MLRRCAEREETWINEQIEASFNELYRLGHAHSVECWREGRLVGGLYGVRLGAAFFGESMFSTRSNASKVALAWLVARLVVGRFQLLDCQFMTDHLRSLGAIEIAQRDYRALLASALSAGGEPGSGAGAALGAPDFGALDGLLDEAAGAEGGVAPGWVIAQLLGQTS